MTAYRQFLEAKAAVAPATAGGRHHMLITRQDAPGRGHGLHFSPSPAQSLDYYQGPGEPRFLACEVDITSLIPLGNKCKAPRCRVLCEVDQFGDPVAGDAPDDEGQENAP